MASSRMRLGALFVVILLLLVAAGLFVALAPTPAPEPATPEGGAPATDVARPAPTTDATPIRRDRERPATSTTDPVAAPDDPGDVAVSDPSSSTPDVPIVEVHVEDDAGGAVAGARVTAIQPFLDEDELRALPEGTAGDPSGTTDDAGDVTLRFEREHPTFVQVVVEKDGRAAIGERLQLPDRGVVRVTLTITPSTRVVGRVTDTAGGALVGARVVGAFRTASLFELRLLAVTDERGEYALPALPTALLQGTQVVSASAAAHVTSNLGLEPQTGDVRLDFELAPGIVVTGRCIAEGGGPVTGVRVLWESHGVETGDDGTFSLGVLPTTGGVIGVVPERQRPLLVHVAGGAPGVVDVGDVVLRAGLAVTGDVVDRDGRPVADASVSALSLAVGQWVRSAETGRDGRFELPHLGDGPHVVQVRSRAAGGGAAREADVRGVLAGATDVRVVLGGATSVLLKFLDEADRTPVRVDDVTVELVPVGTGLDAGHSKLGFGGSNLSQVRIPVKDAGVYDLTVTIPGYDVGIASGVVVSDGAESVIEVLFRRAPR